MPSIIASDGQQARPEAEHRAALRLVIELDDAVGHRERVVVRQRDDAGSQADAAGALDRGGDEHLGRRDELDPPEWCSPIHASANPMLSRYSTVSSWPRIARVGSMSNGSSHGGMKAPSRSASRSTADGVLIG